MTISSNHAGDRTGAGACQVKRLWTEARRHERIARIDGLMLQSCDRAAKVMWTEAERIRNDVPTGVRVDLPSAKVFARILGLMRSTAALKHRPVLELELSAQDIANAIGYGKSTVEAALRWLGDDVIEHRGMPVARGLGVISRVRRKAWAVLKGALKKVYRTTATALTLMGRSLLGLGESIAPGGRPKRSAEVKRSSSKPRVSPVARPSPSPHEPPPGSEPGEATLTREQEQVWLSNFAAGIFPSAC